MERYIRRYSAFIQALWYVIIGNVLLMRKWNYIGGKTLAYWTVKLRVIYKQKNYIK